MPTQKRLWELRVERSGALRESPTPEQFSALSPFSLRVLRASQYTPVSAHQSVQGK